MPLAGTEAGATIWADGPSGSPAQPEKAQIRKWATVIETAILAGLSNGGLIYDTKTNLDADLAHAANSSAWVIGDETTANNGIYRKSGASGSGAWTRVADLPRGDPGSSNVVGTSASSVAIGTGSKTFAIVEADRGWGVGARLRGSSNANAANFVEGPITSYADNSLTLNVDLIGGTGTHADWTFNLTGEHGESFEWKGAWATGTVYVMGDTVKQSGSSYICISDHTSGTFSTDLAAGKWDLMAQRGSDGDGSGDMLASTYDPQGKVADAFDRANHTGTQTLSTISDAGNAAGKDVGTTAGTVAAGDDSRITGALSSSSTITDAFPGRIQSPTNQTYNVCPELPFGMTISKVTTICESGTCTATFKINTTALGGTANSVSTTKQSQAQSSSNVASAGDALNVTISSNSSCVGLSFVIEFTRALS